MARYVSRNNPRAWFDDGELHDTRTVQPLGQPHVESGPVDTGLVDENGNAILRVPDEVGFYQKDQKKR